MKAKELKKMLEIIPDNAEIIMSSDAEGNDFSEVDGVYGQKGDDFDGYCLYPSHDRLKI